LILIKHLGPSDGQDIQENQIVSTPIELENFVGTLG
jgi:hypothetical protein